MTPPIEDLFALPVLDKFVLCSPRRGLSALVNRAAVDRLAALSDTNGSWPEGELGRLAQAALAPAPPPPLPNRGPPRPCFLGLIPTRACNGACRYCDFGAAQAPATTMDLGIALRAVDWMAESVRAAGREVLEVHFFGGEPLLAADLVRRVVVHAHGLADRLGLTAHLEVSTNGVHDGELMRWAGSNFDAVVLSLDGPAEIHDRHRPLAGGRGSHAAATATAAVLSAAHAQLCLRACITQHNVDRMGEIATWFAREFRPKVVNFEAVNQGELSRAAGLLAPHPFSFARGFAAAQAELDRAGIQTVCASLAEATPRYTACPLGQDAIMVGPDGALAGCYLPPRRWQARGLDLGLGRASAEGMQVDLAAVERLRRLVLDKPRCQRCFCRWTCAGGCHVDVTYPGCDAAYPGICVQTRVLTAWSLLLRMDHGREARDFLASEAAMEGLALWPSDRLNDWRH